MPRASEAVAVVQGRVSVCQCVFMPPADGTTDRADLFLINMQSRVAMVSHCTSNFVHLSQDLEFHVVLACDACGWEHNNWHGALIGRYI